MFFQPCHHSLLIRISICGWADCVTGIDAEGSEVVNIQYLMVNMQNMIESREGQRANAEFWFQHPLSAWSTANLGRVWSLEFSAFLTQVSQDRRAFLTHGSLLEELEERSCWIWAKNFIRCIRLCNLKASDQQLVPLNYRLGGLTSQNHRTLPDSPGSFGKKKSTPKKLKGFTKRKHESSKVSTTALKRTDSNPCFNGVVWVGNLGQFCRPKTRRCGFGGGPAFFEPPVISIP